MGRLMMHYPLRYHLRKNRSNRGSDVSPVFGGRKNCGPLCDCKPLATIRWRILEKPLLCPYDLVTASPKDLMGYIRYLSLEVLMRRP